MKLYGLSLVVVILAACATPTPVAPTKPTQAPPAPVVVSHPAPPTLRLPAGVTPVDYAITATVTPGAPRMATTTRIRVKLDASTDLLWLNASTLEFGAASVDFSGQTVRATVKSEGGHFIGLGLPRAVGPGEATVTIESTAPISLKENLGVFAAVEAGETYVYTQFEAIGARRAWPCFDEPGFKVPWQLTLKVPKGLRTFSNTNPVSETTDGDVTTVQFGQTKPLPSYLVAFAVGPFDVVDAGHAGKNQVPVRIITPKGRGARAKYAVETTAQAIEQLEAYFGTPYPYEKADQLAISAPTWFGAMEHPGLITWSEPILLSEPKEDTIERQREELDTAVHELAHQWFGNLVTLAWWDDIWLNESFASWMESRTVLKWKPEWGGAVSRVRGLDGAMSNDSLATARRMRQPIESHDDILNAFDGITYAKGEAVLNMFEQWLGPDVFQRGVQQYLAKHAWGTATAGDFLSAMSAAAGRDVSGPFMSFIDQAGVPLVSATLDCAPGQPVRVKLAQQRFVPKGSTAAATTWQVPVCLRWPGGQQCTLLAAAEATLTLDAKTCPAWLLPNVGSTGFYRSRPLAPALVGEAALTPAEKLGVVADLDALVSTGELSVLDELATVPFSLAANTRQLTERAIGTASMLHGLVPVKLRPKLASWVQKHFGAKARAAGFTDKATESDDQRLLRPSLLGLVGTVGEDTALRTTAVKQTRAWLKSRDAVAPELVDTVLELAAWQGEAKLFDELLAAAKRETDRNARDQLLRTLGSFREPKLADRARALVLDPSLDLRETFSVLNAQAEDEATREGAYAFEKAHYEELAQRMPEDWEAGLIWLGTSACSTERLADLETFFKARTTGATGGPRTYANAIEAITQCIAWRERQVPLATKYFEQWR